MIIYIKQYPQLKQNHRTARQRSHIIGLSANFVYICECNIFCVVHFSFRNVSGAGCVMLIIYAIYATYTNDWIRGASRINWLGYIYIWASERMENQIYLMHIYINSSRCPLTYTSSIAIYMHSDSPVFFVFFFYSFDICVLLDGRRQVTDRRWRRSG